MSRASLHALEAGPGGPRGPVPRRRTWTKVHLTFFTTASHAGVGPDALLLMPVVFTAARWDGESESAEVRDNAGDPVSLAVLAGWTQLPVPRVRRALAKAQGTGTLAVRDGCIIIPKFRKWQLNPAALRKRRQREREQEQGRPLEDVHERHELEEEASPPSALELLRRRHTAFLDSLPPGPQRLRVGWLIGTPRELAEGLGRETTWVAQALCDGDRDKAGRLVEEVFEYAWQRAYDGELDERLLGKSLWGQAFRARLREWADAQLQLQREREQEGRREEEAQASRYLTFDQLAELSGRASLRYQAQAGGAM